VEIIMGLIKVMEMVMETEIIKDRIMVIIMVKILETEMEIKMVLTMETITVIVMEKIWGMIVEM